MNNIIFSENVLLLDPYYYILQKKIKKHENAII